MPSFEFIKSSTIDQSFRNELVKGRFDLDISEVKETFSGSIDIENKEWKIGAIVGASGTGKSQIANHCFGDLFINPRFGKKSVIDEMPKDADVDVILKNFSLVGFASPPSWLKPYKVLSQGEQMRVQLAYALSLDRECFIFDEFTSVVDRNVAKTACLALNKAINKSEKQFIAVTCHRDILEWLQPDWVYDTDEQRFFFASTKDQSSTFVSIQAQITLFGNYSGSITI